MSAEEEYVKPTDVARRLKVSRGAVYKWIREGKLRAVKFGDRAVRIPRSSIEAFEQRAREEYEKEDQIQKPALAG
jgi:excisionase family DNA binding protein